MSMRSCTRSGAALPAAFLAACALASFAGLAHAQEPAETKRLVITLDEVRAFPEAYRRVPFELDLLYHGPRNLFNPFFTIFEPSSYANFAAWPADTPIFERSAFCTDHPLFYVERKDDDLQRAIIGMRPFTFFTARCIVRSTAQGRAWIEVIGVPHVGPLLDSTDLCHLVRANAFAAGGEMERALVEVEMARLLGVPARFVARCRGEEGRIALDAKKPERAMVALQQAWKALPEDRTVGLLLERANLQLVALRQQQVASVPADTPPPLPPKSSPPSVEPQAPPAPVPPTAPETAPETTPPTEKPDSDGR